MTVAAALISRGIYLRSQTTVAYIFGDTESNNDTDCMPVRGSVALMLYCTLLCHKSRRLSFLSLHSNSQPFTLKLEYMRDNYVVMYTEQFHVSIKNNVSLLTVCLTELASVDF